MGIRIQEGKNDPQKCKKLLREEIECFEVQYVLFVGLFGRSLWRPRDK
jgi:hypothetical protein